MRTHLEAIADHPVGFELTVVPPDEDGRWKVYDRGVGYRRMSIAEMAELADMVTRAVLEAQARQAKATMRPLDCEGSDMPARGLTREAAPLNLDASQLLINRIRPVDSFAPTHGDDDGGLDGAA